MVELSLAWRKHRFIYCCIIAGMYFDVTILAWRKHATVYSGTIGEFKERYALVLSM
jgi:hypothetical protein